MTAGLSLWTDIDLSLREAAATANRRKFLYPQFTPHKMWNAVKRGDAGRRVSGSINGAKGLKQHRQVH